MITRRLLRSNRKGFSLVEVMLVVFVLALTALVFAATFPTAQISRMKAVHMTYAISLGQQKVEELKAAGYSGIALSDPVTTAVGDLPGGQQTVSVTQYNPHVKKISVSITWGGYRQVGGNVTLVTLVSDHG